MKRMTDVAQAAREELVGVSIIVNELVRISLEHKKKALVLILIELWIHGLMFQHLSELKHIWELIPFLH